MLIIGQISSQATLETAFEASFPDKFEHVPNYYIQPQSVASVITSKQKNVFSSLNFGMNPFWSKQFTPHTVASVNGDGVYHGQELKNRIALHPSYRRPIRETRCLIPADYILIANQNGEIYRLYSTSEMPFAIAGVYDIWKESYRDEHQYSGFSVLTVPGNTLLSENYIENIPLLLSPTESRIWLNNDTSLTDISELMKLPAEDAINGHTISSKLFYDKANGPELLETTGNLLLADQELDGSKFAGMMRGLRFLRNSLLQE